MSTDTKNSNMVIMTATSIVVALSAVAYALYVQNQSVQKVRVAVPTPEIMQMQYEEGSNNPVVLSLNGRNITREEIIENFEASGSQLPPQANIEQIFPLLQDQYVVGQLLEQAAKDDGFTAKSPEIAKQMNFALSQSLRAAYIKSVGERNITDNDVKNAYKDVIENAPDIVERRASHILVDSAEKATSLIQKINEGADFAELAKENSQGPTGPKGGDLGFFAASDMVPEFSKAAFSMEIESVSAEPVQTQFGFHVIKVTGEQDRAKPSFDDVKTQLKAQLQQAVLAEKIDQMRANVDMKVFDYDGNPIETEDDKRAETQPIEQTDNVESIESETPETKSE
jgi:peptidyl-prolyl cis-trans isomerase C